MAHRDDRAPAARPSRHRAKGVEPVGDAAAIADAARIADRALPAVYPADLAGLPDPDRRPALRHGPRAGLSRPPGSLPPSDRPASAATHSRSLSAPAHAPRGTGASRLGALRPPADRQGEPAADGLRHGLE